MFPLSFNFRVKQETKEKDTAKKNLWLELSFEREQVLRVFQLSVLWDCTHPPG